MAGDQKRDEIRRAAQELAEHPRDVGAWWTLGEVLMEAGEKKVAIESFTELGQRATDLAFVGLAVACIKKLEELGDTRGARALLHRVETVHGKGSKRVDPKAGRKPPSPPSPVDGTNIQKGTGVPVDQARSAIKQASDLAKKRSLERMPPTPLVNFLSAEDLEGLVETIELARYERGDVVVDTGDDADALYWIARGAAEVSRGDKLLGELRSDAFFGEIALVGATTRTARVACLEETDILVMPASGVAQLAERSPSLAKVLASHARARLLSNVMRTSELFKRLSAEERRGLLPSFETMHVEAGEVIVKAGAPNDSLYVLASGRCAVGNDGGTITELKAGDGFGEMSMLGNKPASFNVTALESGLLLRIARNKFDEIAAAHPGLLAEVYRIWDEREKANSDAMIHDASDLVV